MRDMLFINTLNIVFVGKSLWGKWNNTLQTILLYKTMHFSFWLVLHHTPWHALFLYNSTVCCVLFLTYCRTANILYLWDVLVRITGCLISLYLLSQNI